MFTLEERNNLIENYMPLANKLAWRECRRTPVCVTIDELQSAAYLGLVDAASKCKNLDTFAAFASLRIVGEMRDYLRQLQWKDESMVSLDAGNDSEGTLKEVVEDDYRPMEEFFQLATEGLNGLGQRIVFMYYVERHSMREIGEFVGVCESRVSQMLTEQRRIISRQCDKDDLWAMLAA